MSDTSRSALAARLGVKDIHLISHMKDPMPLVTLEEYFDNNDPADLDLHFHDLLALRDRDDVADLRFGITSWNGSNDWPGVEYIYLVTSARVSDAKRWFSDIGLTFDTFRSGREHREREPLDVPKGYKIVWGWWD